MSGCSGSVQFPTVNAEGLELQHNGGKVRALKLRYSTLFESFVCIFRIEPKALAKSFATGSASPLLRLRSVAC